jgi:hypothetical protein
MDLQANLEENITNMQAIDSDDVMLYYLVISKTLEYIRDEVYEHKGWTLFSTQYKKITHRDLSPSQINGLQKLDELLDEDLSLLYNLIFIDFLAEIYPQTKMASNIKQLIEEKITHLINSKKI